jgi:hypothetical protein
MSDRAEDERPEGTCCGGGKSWQPKAGAPLIHACKLCPNSPTYWRKPSGPGVGTPSESA